MQEMIYLDNAATTWPKPPSVLRRVNRCFKEACGNPGRSAHLLSMRAAEEVYHARCALNRFFWRQCGTKRHFLSQCNCVAKYSHPRSTVCRRSCHYNEYRT